MRRFITLCLFAFTVPYAVFGQGGVDSHVARPDIKHLTAVAQEYIEEKWPKAQSSLHERFPKVVQTMGTTLDALDPSAGSTSAHADSNSSPWLI